MENNLIDRQVAIDALKEHRALYCDNTPDTFSKLSYAEKSRVDELDTAIATLVNLPSAQPERKTGKWIWKTLDVYKCSECETETHVDECMEEPIYNFCPYCGARLVQEGEDNDS